MSVEKRPIGLSPKTWSLNPIPDGDGGDSNVDHNNDDKEDDDSDFFFFIPYHGQTGLPFEECQINQEGKELICLCTGSLRFAF